MHTYFNMRHLERMLISVLYVFLLPVAVIYKFMVRTYNIVHKLRNPIINSAHPATKKLIVDFDVENQLRSEALKERVWDRSLPNGSIDLRLRCPKLTTIGWGGPLPLCQCLSRLRVDLSGCPKLESIKYATFGGCEHLVSVVFGEHSNIKLLGAEAFGKCFALKNITLPNKLEVIELAVFIDCRSLKRVVCNTSLKTIGDQAFR